MAYVGLEVPSQMPATDFNFTLGGADAQDD